MNYRQGHSVSILSAVELPSRLDSNFLFIFFVFKIARMVDGRPTNYQNGNHSSIPLEVLVNNLLTECSLNRSDISVVGSLANGMNKMLETRDHTSAKQNVIVTTAIDKNCQSASFLAEDLFSEESSVKGDQVSL